MSDFSFNPSRRSAFQRLQATSVVSKQSQQDDCPFREGQRESPQAEGHQRDICMLAGLEQAVTAINESTDVLHQVSAAVAQVRMVNESAAQARICDVDRVSELIAEISERFGDEERRANTARAAHVAAMQRLLG